MWRAIQLTFFFVCFPHSIQNSGVLSNASAERIAINGLMAHLSLQISLIERGAQPIRSASAV